MIRTNHDTLAVRGAIILGFLAALVAVGLMLTVTKPAHARDFTVTNTNNDGAGSLRRVIDLANLTAGPDAIKFAIPGEGVKSIRPTSELPVITEAVAIDGYTQPGSSVNTLADGTNARILVELDGSEEGSSFANGLEIGADNVAVRGLAINGFGNNGISIGSGGTGNRIEGNFIGNDPSGTVDVGNRLSGVAVFGSGNTVGGTSPFQRNVISGNGGFGVGISNFQAPGNNKVEGNLIGTKKNGTSALGNSASGVDIRSSGNLVGGATLASANTVAFNAGDGIAVALGSANSVSPFNSIFSNAGLGIDLLGGTENAAGATANDPGDADAGPNDLQNKPILASATNSGGATTVKGRLNSTPDEVFLIRFFSSPSGNEGKKRVGVDSVTTDANGDASFTSPVQSVAAGQRITATAESFAGGNSSEFSGPKGVVRQ